MRLCIVSSGDFYSNYGGGQVYVRNIVNEFIKEKDELGLELSIISFHITFPNLARQNSFNEIPLYEISPTGQVEELLRIIKPDVVHANGEKALMAHLCKKLDITCVVTAHHGGIVCPAGSLLNHRDEICQEQACFKNCLPCYLKNIRSGIHWYPFVKHISQNKYIKLGKILERLPFIPFVTPIGQAGLSVEKKLDTWKQLINEASLFIAPSLAIADALIRNGAKREKVVVSPHGIPIQENENNRETEIKDNIVHFYYVGRISYVKGVHVLLEAFHCIRNDNIQLHLIGGVSNKAERIYMGKLQRQYQKDNRIVWHGKVSSNEVEHITRHFQALVHPTICLEVFGLDIAEALSQHKHVIATRCGGAEMQIREIAKPWLIRPNNVAELKTAIEWYINEGSNHEEPYSLISIEQHVRNLYNIFRSETESFLQYPQPFPLNSDL